jgi:hypothetical protein
MDSLDLLYNATLLQAKNKGIVNFKGDRDEWKQKKRNIRRADRMNLKNASKSSLSYNSD